MKITKMKNFYKRIFKIDFSAKNDAKLIGDNPKKYAYKQSKIPPKKWIDDLFLCSITFINKK